MTEEYTVGQVETRLELEAEKKKEAEKRVIAF